MPTGTFVFAQPQSDDITGVWNGTDGGTYLLYKQSISSPSKYVAVPILTTTVTITEENTNIYHIIIEFTTNSFVRTIECIGVYGNGKIYINNSSVDSIEITFGSSIVTTKGVLTFINWELQIEYVTATYIIKNGSQYATTTRTITIGGLVK